MSIDVRLCTFTKKLTGDTAAKLMIYTSGTFRRLNVKVNILTVSCLCDIKRLRRTHSRRHTVIYYHINKIFPEPSGIVWNIVQAFDNVAALHFSAPQRRVRRVSIPSCVNFVTVHFLQLTSLRRDILAVTSRKYVNILDPTSNT